MTIILQPLQSRYARSRIRWGAALGWTALTVVLLLIPGDSPLIESLFERLVDVAFTVGHAVTFALLAWLWYGALLGHTTPRRAIAFAFMIALLVGATTELGQSFSAGRATSLADLIADVLGALLALWWLRRATQTRAPVP